jgi:redox-sensitive bicupin YhaK (pirin superfamily)
MSDDPILDVRALGFPWRTDDPFLFCVHHRDAYPAGNAELGPAASLAGRDIGQDFAGKDGWNMYHGDAVPGFPQHPHRGFETVTIVRRGLVDHSDSLGATARFGSGDVQWLTAGEGIVHSEMFPLVDPAGPNTLELFQIWLNLPAADKMVPPHFAMLWHEEIPTLTARDDAGLATEVRVIAGVLDGAGAPPPPPPRSWAARADAHVGIFTIAMQPNSTWTLPGGPRALNRTVYFFRGSSVAVGERTYREHAALRVRSDLPLVLRAGDDETEILVLQGRPIAQPVMQHGPFVMTTRTELQQAFEDYQRTKFGGWPWPSDAPTHGRAEPRFAKHADGRVERRHR